MYNIICFQCTKEWYNLKYYILFIAIIEYWLYSLYMKIEETVPIWISVLIFLGQVLECNFWAMYVCA